MATASQSRQSRRRAAARRPPHRYKPIKLGKKRAIIRAVGSVAILVAILTTWAVIARRTAPMGNTSREHFDAILVLGSPADSDGNPTPDELAKVSEGVQEYERGVAPRLIFTGGAARNEFVEAEVMARAAAARGIPPSAIFVETKAKDTIQNACYSTDLMEKHGWHSAEVITNAQHLPRAGLIFSHTPLDWRMHVAPPLQARRIGSAWKNAVEIAKTTRYLVYANWAERCEP